MSTDEIGHNLGATHDRDNVNDSDITDGHNGYGFKNCDEPR